MKLSVVICTHNPKPAVFAKVLEALMHQSLQKEEWELTVVDNCSSVPLKDSMDLAWHPNAKIVEEPRPGLSHARVTGINNSNTGLIVFADDDNVLSFDYLEKSLSFSNAFPKVGCFGGKSIPVFESEPPVWFFKTGINLGCQDYGEELYISDFSKSSAQLSHYPQKAPIGTGMVILKKAFQAYLQEAATNPERMRLGRRGNSLSSGEDNDIILSIIKNGYEIAYVPSLVVKHLIPANRYSENYLKRMAFESNRTWVKVLEIHGINPWRKISKFAYAPRKLKSFLQHRPWRSPLAAIRWKSACGTFKGLSEL